MALEKIRRFVCAISAVAFLLATVLPQIGVDASMADIGPGMSAVPSGMTCAGCAIDLVKYGPASCAQSSCVGLAVIAETDPLLGSNHQTFFPLATIRPDELSFVPPTPPI